MFCNKCGRLIEENSKFCGVCGTVVPVQNKVQEDNNITPDVQISKNDDEIVNQSTKKYAIFSIVIPAISIFVYGNMGLTIYLAILLALIGFDFAKKGRMYNKTLSIIGYILNSILVVMAIFMYMMTAL